MQHQALTLTYSARTGSQAASRDLLLIEQEEWQPYTGYVTKAEMVRALARMLYGAETESQVNCGVAGGQVVAAIYVYRLEPGVIYQLLASAGTLSEPAAEEKEMTETVQVNLETEAELRYPVASLLETRWLSAWDEQGNRIDGPAVTLVGGKLTWSLPVFGSLKVRWLTNRDVWMLTIDRREEAVENLYSAVLLALPSGGRPELLTFAPPPTAEEIEEEDCGWGRLTTGDIEGPPDHPLDDPTASPHRRTVIIDFCSQTVQSDTMT